jgi:hypothetical protein
MLRAVHVHPGPRGQPSRLLATFLPPGDKPGQKPDPGNGPQDAYGEEHGPTQALGHKTGGDAGQDPAHGHEAGEQGVLGGGEALVAEAHQEGNKGRRSQAAADVFDADGGDHGRVVFPQQRYYGKSQVRKGLQETEDPQGPVDPHFGDEAAVSLKDHSFAVFPKPANKTRHNA